MEMFTAYLSVRRRLVDGSPHLGMRVRGTRLYLMLIESNMDETNMVCPSFTRKTVGRVHILHIDINLPVFHLHSITSPLSRLADTYLNIF